MTPIDWTKIDWWDLPGPAGFLRNASERIASESSGLVGVSLPARRPKKLLEALARLIKEESGLSIVSVNAATLDAKLSPAHALAIVAGTQPGEIRSASDFVRATDLANIVFILDSIPPKRWDVWSLFLRAFRAERERAGRLDAPRIAIIQPNAIPPDDAANAIGANILSWRGVVARSDMQLYVETLLGRGSDLVHRTAVATITEMACWDPDVAELLASQKDQDRLNPCELLSNLSVHVGFPCWSNGLVNLWDGDPHVHTLALLQTNSRELLARRIWRAHVGTIFPAIELVRQTFVRRYFGALEAVLPIDKQFHQKTRRYDHPLQLEINDVAYYLRTEVTSFEGHLLNAFKELRKAMAHMEPAPADLIIRASRAWTNYVATADFSHEATGWNWPRCGQRLILLVGPSGAGKSTYAANTYAQDEVISSDAIRDELFGSLDMAGSQDRVFETLRQRAKARLAAGRSVVVDATNLNQRDRLANAAMIPDDLDIEYVLIDRPMPDKQRDGGWRLQKPNLLEGHARTFARELPDILAGDHRPNVTVHDLRVED